MEKVRVESENGKTKVYVGDKKLENVTSIRFEQDVDTAPCFDVGLKSLPDFEVDSADLRFSITPNSVVSALNVIRTAFREGIISDEAILSSVCCLFEETVSKNPNPNTCVLVKDGEILVGQIVSSESIELYGSGTKRDRSGKLIVDEKKILRKFAVETLD